MSQHSRGSFELLGQQELEREDGEVLPAAAADQSEDEEFVAHSGSIPAPPWFDPGQPQGGAGRSLAQFRRLPAWVRACVYAVMAVGGGTFSLLFVLSARCEAKCERTGSPARTFWCAGAGTATFWTMAIVTCNNVTRPGLLTWDDQPTEMQSRPPAPRPRALSRIDVKLRKAQLFKRKQKGSVVQKLARGVHISRDMQLSLSWWRGMCEIARFSTCAYFVLVAGVCTELLISDREQLDGLSWFAAEFAELLPDAPSDGCYSKPTTDILLWMMITFYLLAGVALATMLRWMLLAVGLSSVLVCDHVDDLRRVISGDPSTWPYIAPIRNLDPTTDVLVRHEFDRDGINVLSSFKWKADIQRALYLLSGLIGALSNESNELAKLKSKTQKCMDGNWLEGEETDPPNEQTLKRLGDVVRFCDDKNGVVKVTDGHVYDVAKILGYKVLSSRTELCKDDMAWEVLMRRPTIELAQKTIPLLSEFGYCLTSLFVMIWSMCMMFLPVAAASKNVYIITLVSFSPLPLMTVWPIAVLGTSCDELLSELNDMRSERLSIDTAHRIEALRGYLRNLNREQGLGFVFFGVVLDKGKIMRLGGVLASVLTSAVAALVHYGVEQNDEKSK